MPTTETPAERELRLAWAHARREFRRNGTPYNECARLTAATDGIARERAARFSYDDAAIEALCSAVSE